MILFSNKAVFLATSEDLPAIKVLLDSAYRGEESKNGWTTEAHLIAGDERTSLEELEVLIQKEGTVFLAYRQNKAIVACVNLQKTSERIYLGMLSVSPQLQGKGIGKEMLVAAEEYAKQVNCFSIYMTVISLRYELIDWYKRFGYTDTGERKTFKEDGRSGRHLQPLEFMVMEKKMVGFQ